MRLSTAVRSTHLTAEHISSHSLSAMELFGKILPDELAVVAEIGLNHEGSYDKAKELVRLAAAAGADAVKLQSFTPERYAARAQTERLDRLRRFGLDASAHAALAEEARSCGISFFSSALSEDWAEPLGRIASAIKIASGDLTFEPVVRAATATGRPIVISTGAGDVEEIDRTVSWVRDEADRHQIPSRLVLLHCVSAYPAPPDECNLLSIPYMAARYDLPIGYSHHALEQEPCLAAVALGACVIEVHFTDRKEGREFRDHELSLEPGELERLVGRLHLVHRSRGHWGKGVQPAEREGRSAMRKGIVAARDIPAGTEIMPSDLMFARPATGFDASRFEELLGRRLNRRLKYGESVNPGDLTEGHSTR